ncbi:SPOR domain-containing protein [Parvibaculum sp.]|uniref:SPOR domain-containing protein n=1 Tax=Parvibaculum sp. TaxID=2024848 RepID=UPI0032116C66
MAALLILCSAANAAPPVITRSGVAASDVDSDFESANRAIDTGRYEDAVASLDRAIESGGLDQRRLALAYHHRGIARQKLGLQSLARDDYTKAIDLGTLPRDVAARAYYNRGIARASAGDNLGAESDYTKAIDLAPDHGAAYHNRANLEREHRDYATAIRDYGAAIQRITGEQRKLPLFGRALAFERSGNTDAAVADLREALVIDPDYEPARKKLEALGEPLVAAGGSGQQVKVAPADGWSTTAVRAEPVAAPAQPAAEERAISEQQQEAAPVSGRYRLQLGSFRKHSSAASAWADAQRRDPSLASFDHNIDAADLGPKGVWYRLKAGSFQTAEEARAHCSQLTAKGLACVVVAR